MEVLRDKCENEMDHHFVTLIKAMYDSRTVYLRDEKIKPERGVMQGSIMAPFLFNVYLEYALKDNSKLRSMI